MTVFPFVLNFNLRYFAEAPRHTPFYLFLYKILSLSLIHLHLCQSQTNDSCMNPYKSDSHLCQLILLSLSLSPIYICVNLVLLFLSLTFVSI